LTLDNTPNSGKKNRKGGQRRRGEGGKKYSYTEVEKEESAKLELTGRGKRRRKKVERRGKVKEKYGSIILEEESLQSGKGEEKSSNAVPKKKIRNGSPLKEKNVIGGGEAQNSSREK